MTVHFKSEDLEFLTACGIDTKAEAAGVKVKNPDSTVLLLQQNGITVNRENYLAVAFMGNPPDDSLTGELDAELEAEIPRELRQGWDDEDDDQ